MDFLIREYEYMIELLKGKNYHFCDYINHKNYKKCVILRHDVDFSLEKALEIAKVEYKNNVRSTFFVLISTNFYNVFSKESYEILSEIKSLGHDIGLHFDEKRYNISDSNSLDYYVQKERKFLEELLSIEVKAVSMHRPSKWILEKDLKFNNIINTYSNYFFKEEFKYISDSRMYWREDVLDIIEKETYDKLHVLTHPIWYAKKNDSMKMKLINFVNDSKLERYRNLNDNFRGLEAVLIEEEII